MKSCLIEFCLTVRLCANDGEFRNLGASDFRSLRLGNKLTIDLRIVTLIDSSLGRDCRCCSCNLLTDCSEAKEDDVFKISIR